MESGVGVSAAIVVIASGGESSIGFAKRLAEETAVSLKGKVVTAVYDDCVMLEELDRSSAVRCPLWWSLLRPGMVVDVSGRIGLRYGEKVITGPVIADTGARGSVEPLGIACALPLRIGVDLSGMVVRVAGRITGFGAGYFVISDGSGAMSPRGVMGIEVSMAPKGEWKIGTPVAVTGVVCREVINSQPAAIIRPLADPKSAAYGP
jgi:hypothetical protein